MKVGVNLEEEEEVKSRVEESRGRPERMETEEWPPRSRYPPRTFPEPVEEEEDEKPENPWLAMMEGGSFSFDTKEEVVKVKEVEVRRSRRLR